MYSLKYRPRINTGLLTSDPLAPIYAYKCYIVTYLNLYNMCFYTYVVNNFLV